MLVPQRLGASSFPAQGDDTTSSVGVFRVMVEPGFRALLAPSGIYNGTPATAVRMGD